MKGIAFDLGTTTIVAYLCDLDAGRIEKSTSCPNEQIKYGLDVLSRVSFQSASYENAQKLSDALGDQICRMYDEISSGQDAPKKALFVGNPVIMGSILHYDFAKKGIDAIRIPGIGHYVGADALAGAMLAEKDRNGKNILLIDIGTNTEIILLSDKAKTATSAAAGPAMEGGNLKCGMRGEEGAIEFVKLTETVSTNSDIVFKVIGDTAPRGICGSGYFSLLKLLIDKGVIDNNGYLLSKKEALQANVPARMAGRIHESNDRDNTENKDRYFSLTESIMLSQEDIRNLQLAIAAIRTGVEIVISEAKLTDAVIDNIYLAGAFGNKITIDSLIALNMLPKSMNDRIVQVGNIAGIGACSLLMDSDKITNAINLKKDILTVSLADHVDFQRIFFEKMNFAQ